MKHIACELNNMQYMIFCPDDHKQDTPSPAILFLHGAGTRGWTVDELVNHSFIKAVSQMNDFPFCIFFPICPEDTWYDAMGPLRLLTGELLQLPWIDARRIYLTGCSMGGYGSWQLAMSMPEAFAAVAPVCGGGMYWNTGRLRDVPVWAFHGAKDEAVLPEESIKMVDGVNRAGGSARLTIYPDNGHDAWTDTYSNPALYEWFLSHEKRRD